MDAPISCLLDGYPTTWVQWEIAKDGYLTFTLSPENIAEDLDFAVYKLHPNKNCARKELVRCMMAGINLGNIQSSLPCLGPTGLSLKEFKSNTTEVEGCDPGSNNFLAALECKKGERYVLAVQNFDNTAGGFYLDFCGTAMLPCDSSQCLEFTGRGSKKNREFVVYNQEISGDSLKLSLFIAKLDLIEVNIRNEKKVVVYHGDIRPVANQMQYEIPLTVIPAGEYSLELKQKKKKVIGFFSKSNSQ